MITEMVKIQLGMPLAIKNEVLTWLQEEEILHIEKIKDQGEPSHSEDNTDKLMADVQFILEFIARIKRELSIIQKKDWRNIFAGKPTSLMAGLDQSLENISIDNIDQEVRVISDELARINARQEEIRRLSEELEPWRDLQVTGKELRAEKDFYYALLVMGVQEEALIKGKLAQLKTGTWQEVNRIMEKKRGHVFIEVAAAQSEVEKLNKIINETNATVVSLPVPDESQVNEYISTLQTEQQNNKNSYEEYLVKGRSLLRLEKDLKFAYDALLHRKERVVAMRQGVQLTRVAVITGWIPKDYYKQFSQRLQKDFVMVAIEIDKQTEEVPPVALKNSKLIEPFEAVTNIYGQPKYHELDPTGPLALFFLVSFSLALTDAGYGLVMMVGMWLAQRHLKLKRQVKKMVRLLFYAGAATVLAGALTGGWFGIELEKLPASEIKNLLLSFKLVDPVQSPMSLLVVAFVVGIIQLLFAWVVRAYDHARQKDYIALIFDDIGWILMVVFILSWALSSRGVLLVNWTRPLLIAVIVVASLLVLTGGRSFKNPALKLGGGLLSLYGLVSFLSDTLSYSRLLALGLATGIIGLVVNMLGVMVGTSVPVVGWVIAAVVLLVGHVFNLGINALGAFIHSGRLQFVEFFPKFLEGGGKPYRPLGRVSRYVDNPKEFI